ncbi:MAG TPA: PAS domain-containing protein [Anaerolineales bacterium]|nr:PAS domain-containing protein [Anaerolineales bacterium]
MADQNSFDNNIQGRINNLYTNQDIPSYASLKDVETMKARIRELEEKLAAKDLSTSPTEQAESKVNEPAPSQGQAGNLKFVPTDVKNSSWLTRFWNWLTEPSADLVDVTERNIARLSTSFLLIIAVLEFVGGLARIPRSGLVNAFLGPIGYTLIPTLVAYGLSKTKWYRAAIFLFSLTFSSLAYISMVLEGNTADISALILVYVPLSLIVASTFLSSWAIFLLTGLNVGLFLLTTQMGVILTPDNFGAQTGIITTIGLVLIVLSNFRARTEQLRLNTLKTINRQLEDASVNLEKRVQDRTHDLELASEVGRIVTARVDNLYQLLSHAVELIRSRFGLYYTQIYLTDRSENIIVLRAGTGDAGRQLLQRGHQLKINLESLNGRAALEKNAVIVSDTTTNPSFLPNPLLPLTRSEMSVPLLIGERVVGVLDMQSELPNALSANNLTAFEALAGQLAIAIQNAALFDQVNLARAEVEEQAKVLSYSGWASFLDALEHNERIGFIYNQDEVLPYTGDTIENTGLNALGASINVSGAEIGKIHLMDDPNRQWTEFESTIIHNTAAQLSRHIENLRLLAQAEKYRRDAEEATKRLTRDGWEEYHRIHSSDQSGFEYDRNSVKGISDASDNSIQTTLAQPVVVRGEVVAKLEAAEAQTMATEEAKDLLAEVSRALSAHIENLRLFEQVETSLSATEKLYDASRALTNASTEQEALDELVQRLDRTGLDRIVAAVKISNDPITAEVVSAWDVDGAEARSIGNKFTEYQLPLVVDIQPGVPVIIEDFDAPHINPLTKKVFKMQNVRSAAILPISADNEILGWLLLETTHDSRKFNSDAIQKYLIFSDQVATVIQRQRLFTRTETQRLEIQKNEARLSEALEIAKLGNWEYDVEKDLFTFNDQFYDIFRTTVEEVGGYQISSAEYAQRFVHPDDLSIVGTEIEKALNSKERFYSTSLEHRIIFSDGSLGYVAVNIKLERDENGKITRYYGANQDITERKLAEDAVRKAQEQFSLAVAGSNDGIWDWDIENDNIYYSPRWKSMLGYEVHELTRGFMEWEELIHPEDKEYATKSLEDYLEQRSPEYNVEIRLRHKDGDYRWINDRGKALRRADGTPYRMAGSHTDITERKLAEETIRQNEARLAEALDIARLANWEYDVEKDIFTFNDQFYSIFHTSVKEIGGYHLSSAEYAQKFVHPGDLPIVGVEIEKALNSKERFYSASLEHRIIFFDGNTGYISVNINVERDENGKITRYYGANQDITERKLAEETIRQNEARLAEALEIARLGNWEYDVEKDIFTFNDHFYSVFRTNVKEVGSYKLSSAEYAQRFVHPDDLPIVGVEIEKALNSKDRFYSVSLEHRIIFPDGTTGYISVSINVERDENGKIIRYYGANQDITDRKMSEEAIRKAQEQYTLAVDGSNDGLWDWNIETNEVYFSPRWKAMVGYTPDELMNGFADFEALLHPDDHDWVLGVVNNYLTGKIEDYNVEFRFQHKNGSYRWILARGKAMRRADGSPYRMAGSHTDITERKQGEELIAQRANQLETVATVSTTTSTVLNPDALLQTVVDLTKERFSLYHAHIYIVDEAWNTLLLAAGAGEVGRHMVAAGHSIDSHREQSLVARAYRERKAVIVNDVREDTGFLPNPLLPDTRAEMAVPMIVGDKVLGVFDLQSEKASSFSQEDALIYNTLASQVAIALQNARLYQEQTSTVTQLRELDRLKSSFLANMSHELRTPLNSILGFADVMLEGLDGPLTDYMDNDLRLIQKNGQHLLHLINDVLDMAKIESGRMNLHPETFIVHEIMEEVTSITSSLANDKNIALYIEPDSNREVQINADRTRLRQVMINLVNNAIKFTEKGHVAIQVEKTDEENVLIAVRDTGLGIPRDQLEDIFNEFTQVDTSTTRKAGGTGLGLPISRRLVEMHGGELWADSSGIEGQGSTFYVRLPVLAQIAEVEKQEKN